ncbi:MAG: hypothetical protein Q4P32_09660, partial [Micrococcales bacterium]|nr:hypothetical protein [Micrococcales bacterium]
MRFRTKTPNVEQDWAGDFVVTLRLRDVAGSAIGSALAEVDAHCADSGQDARSAFGDPTAYAESLDFGAQARPLTRRELARPVLTAAVGAVGMLATLWGDEALRHGRGVVLTVGMFVGLAVLAAALAWLWFDTDRVLRLLVRRPLWGWALLMGHLALLVVA